MKRRGAAWKRGSVPKMWTGFAASFDFKLDTSVLTLQIALLKDISYLQ
jgi:hypothetical protein